MERTIAKERKNDSFLDLLERMKALNSELEKEREFKPHHRSPLAKTMIDNWHNEIDRHNNSLLDRINKKLESLETVERTITKERKNDSILDLLERMKALNSELEKEREFEPHHRSLLAKTMTDNWHNERNSVIENCHNSRKDGRELKATERPIAITYKDNKKDYKKNNKNYDLKDLKTTFTAS